MDKGMNLGRKYFKTLQTPHADDSEGETSMPTVDNRSECLEITLQSSSSTVVAFLSARLYVHH